MVFNSYFTLAKICIKIPGDLARNVQKSEDTSGLNSLLVSSNELIHPYVATFSAIWLVLLMHANTLA